MNSAHPQLNPVPANPATIKWLIHCTRPPKRRLDFPTAVDIDELFQDPVIGQASRLWCTAAGEPAAYAFVHFPYNNLTFEVCNPYRTDALEDEVITWAREVMRVHHGSELSENTLDTSCRAEDAEQIRFLTRHGFKRDGFESISYERRLESAPEPLPLQPGFVFRSLLPGEVEQAVALHQAAFGTKNFTLADRLALMKTPAYTPELDLIVIAPDGTLAGGCICSIEDDVGYTDPVYVHPDHQGKGLARALLNFGLAGLYAHGVHRVHLGTSSVNTAMQHAAEAAGFTCVSRSLWFSLDLTL